VDRPPPLLDRPRLLDLVDRLPLGGVEVVPVVRCFARLLEPGAELLGRIDPGPLRGRGPAEEPPERSESEGPTQPCQRSTHTGDATLLLASCLVSRAPFPLTLAGEAA
jgi:hypothetical protein